MKPVDTTTTLKNAGLCTCLDSRILRTFLQRVQRVVSRFEAK